MGTIKSKVTVIGGGTGLPVLLRGLKKLPIDLTALVTVADDGGSSGEIRNQFNIPAPGDIRNVIAALSEAEPVLLELFQHRFTTNNGLSGHSMGNLLLAALTSVTGNFFAGIREISRVFNVKGEIYPITNERISLYAKTVEGTYIHGESNIPLANQKIERLYIHPNQITPLPEAVEAIKDADLIIISPGSLYTSILPNLIIPNIDRAMEQSRAQIVYVCNIMTQAGETTDFSASDHVRAINHHLGFPAVDAIIVHNEEIDPTILQNYQAENAQPVTYDRKQLEHLGLKVITDDIIDDSKVTVRHDTKKVAEIIYHLLQHSKGG